MWGERVGEGTGKGKIKMEGNTGKGVKGGGEMGGGGGEVKGGGAEGMLK
jgi:hypothetical protein